MPRIATLLCALLATAPAASLAAGPAPAELDRLIDRDYAFLDGLYRHLHTHPELSLHEQETAARIASELKAAGFMVTPGVGGHGVVAVLQRGAGPTVMWRSDLDALPVREETGLPYASTVMATDDSGRPVPVMHACGHDIHMTTLVGLARALNALSTQWTGTVVLIGQPAEERVKGAQAMIADGLFSRFPRPDAVLGMHVKDDLPTGVVGYRAGPAFANVDSVDIRVYGRGGHGSAPHTTVDPVVIAARIVMALQTIVAREINPIEAAVVTVGSIHGGTKHNIIPDIVDLQLTVRSYSDETRRRLLDGIRRNVLAEATGAAAPRPPDVTIGESTPATVNDPELVRRTVQGLKRALGDDRVVEVPPIMGSEDFTYYGRQGIPAFMFNLGTIAPQRIEESRRPGGTPLPSLHSSLYAPDREASIRSGVRAALAAVLENLQAP
ncbi:MAG TPA: amidohydrolase [Candidatus Polarisedimenticolia bacterium]|jgi:hippurate hydrolase|nr:amidohydrolase [Candidatus Polarisedimenticolia bacterium]